VNKSLIFDHIVIFDPSLHSSVASRMEHAYLLTYFKKGATCDNNIYRTRLCP